MLRSLVGSEMCIRDSAKRWVEETGGLAALDESMYKMRLQLNKKMAEHEHLLTATEALELRVASTEQDLSTLCDELVLQEDEGSEQLIAQLEQARSKLMPGDLEASTTWLHLSQWNNERHHAPDLAAADRAFAAVSALVRVLYSRGVSCGLSCSIALWRARCDKRLQDSFSHSAAELLAAVRQERSFFGARRITAVLRLQHRGRMLSALWSWSRNLGSLLMSPPTHCVLSLIHI
eukprot:TRINITY_DN40371_c0_g1_i1.p1 TRINITY_DN40371_c0_g1~~TRINITY_DN40371_c0_g1_i1.p1  ORF type:complete len:234 (+),score=66.36 TRINITY_DN40371_c0_g1_i1:127-828(+)